LRRAVKSQVERLSLQRKLRHNFLFVGLVTGEK
jgi:hypothetical protein